MFRPITTAWVVVRESQSRMEIAQNKSNDDPCSMLHVLYWNLERWMERKVYKIPRECLNPSFRILYCISCILYLVSWMAPIINPSQDSNRNKLKNTNHRDGTQHTTSNGNLNHFWVHSNQFHSFETQPILITNNMVSESSNGNATQSSIGALAMLGNLVTSA